MVLGRERVEALAAASVARVARRHAYRLQTPAELEVLGAALAAPLHHITSHHIISHQISSITSFHFK